MRKPQNPRYKWNLYYQVARRSLYNVNTFIEAV